MKKFILILFAVFVAISLNAQRVDFTNPYATIQIVSSSGMAPNFTIQGVVNDQTGKYDGLSFDIGDVIYIIDGPTCYELPITAVNSASVSILNLNVNDPSGDLANITTGQAMIIRPTPNRDFPIYVAGLRADLQACMQNRYAMQVDTILSDAFIDAKAYAKNALFIENDSVVVWGGNQDRNTSINTTRNFNLTFTKPNADSTRFLVQHFGSSDILRLKNDNTTAVTNVVLGTELGLTTNTASLLHRSSPTITSSLSVLPLSVVADAQQTISLFTRDTVAGFIPSLGRLGVLISGTTGGLADTFQIKPAPSNGNALTLTRATTGHYRLTYTKLPETDIEAEEGVQLNGDTVSLDIPGLTTGTNLDPTQTFFAVYDDRTGQKVHKKVTLSDILFNIYTYDAGNNAMVTATDTTITFAKNSGVGTFTVPSGVVMLSARIDGTSADLSGNAFSIQVNYADGTPPLTNMMPPTITKYDRILEGTPSEALPYVYDIDNTPQVQITGLTRYRVINLNGITNWGLKLQF